MAAAHVPQWTVGDRMRKAREDAQLNQSDLAGKIEIARSSIVNYETDRKMVSRPVLIAWSLATGVPYEWLCHGDTQPCGPPPGRSDGFATKMHYSPTMVAL